MVADTKALAAAEVTTEAYAGRKLPSHSRGEPPPDNTIIQPGSQMWRSYPADNISPESYRDMQRDADLGYVSRLMELYDDIANDYQVGSQLRTRKLAVAGAPITFESGDESKHGSGSAIADAAAMFWESWPTRRQFAVDVLDDFYRGFSCVRPVWDSIGGLWQIVSHEAIEARYFHFKDAVEPLICPIAGTNQGVPIPDGYVYSEFRDKAGPVVRAGCGRSVGKLWIAKGYGFVDTSSYLERFGSPHVQVNLSRLMTEGDPELERIKDAARAFIADQIGIMPEGAKLEVIEAVNKAATVRDVYIVFISFCDLAISKAISGQTLSADAGPGGIGNGGAADEHGDVRQDIKELDAARLEAIIRAQIIAPWTMYHYGPNAPVPKVCVDVAAPEDRVQATLAEKQRAETINILRSAGMRFKVIPLYNEFKFEAPKGVTDADELLPPTAPPQATDVGDPQKGVPAPPGSPTGAPADQ